MELLITFTQDQYDRYKAGLTKMQNAENPVTDAALIAQMKREASAITYAAENGQNNPEWMF
jgi:hypothetical protein